MLKYILKRLFSSIITIVAVVTITFLLIHAIPGGPFDSERNLPENIKFNLEAKFGLNKSLAEQYTIYFKNIFYGDLGSSLVYEDRTVDSIIKNSFPISARIGLCSIIFATILGLFIGTQAAINKGNWQDKLCLFISTFAITTPNFIMATLLIYFFSVKLGFFPAIGIDSPKSYILPILALSAHPMAFISKLTRNNLLEVLQKDYIKAARAKGLSNRRIIYKHALKNAIIPVISYLGSILAFVLTGSFVIENLFGIPGLGQEFIQSIYNRDYTTILGITIFYSTLFILFNFMVDMLYVLIDPRIKLR